MAHAELCPVCLGTGMVSDNTVGNANATDEKTCHGCGGSGWVTVEDSKKNE